MPTRKAKGLQATGTVSLWRIATEAREYRAVDLTGKGAELSGGRWNRPGLPALYCSTSRALACLETVVHLNGGELPLNRFLVRVDVPAAAWAARIAIDANTAPGGWQALPAGKASLDYGDAWLQGRTSLLLEVPSVLMQEETNVIINPHHPEVATLTSIIVRPFIYDRRLVQSPALSAKRK